MKKNLLKTTSLLAALVAIGSAQASSVDVLNSADFAHFNPMNSYQAATLAPALTAQEQDDILYALELSLAIANSVNDMNLSIQEDLDMEVALQASLLSFYKEEQLRQDRPEFPGQVKSGVCYLTPDQIAAGWKPEPVSRPTQTVAATPEPTTLLNEIRHFNRANLKTPQVVETPAETDVAGGLRAFFRNGGQLNKVETNDRSAPVIQSESPQTAFAQAINGFNRGNLRTVETNDRSNAVVDANDMNRDNQRHIAVVLAGEQAARDHVVVKNVLTQAAPKRVVRFADEVDGNLAEIIARRAQNRSQSAIDAIDAERANRQAQWLGAVDPEKAS